MRTSLAIPEEVTGSLATPAPVEARINRFPIDTLCLVAQAFARSQAGATSEIRVDGPSPDDARRASGGDSGGRSSRRQAGTRSCSLIPNAMPDWSSGSSAAGSPCSYAKRCARGQEKHPGEQPRLAIGPCAYPQVPSQSSPAFRCLRGGRPVPHTYPTGYRRSNRPHIRHSAASNSPFSPNPPASRGPAPAWYQARRPGCVSSVCPLPAEALAVYRA